MGKIGWEMTLTGGTISSLRRGPLQAHPVTLTWYQKHSGRCREARLKSRAVTIVHTLLFFVHIITALVEKHTEDSCPLMESLVTVTFGPIISVLVAAQCTLVDCTRPLLALVKHTAMAIFKGATTLDSGVSGVQVMVQLWCLEEEEVDAAERIMVLGSLRTITEDLRCGRILGRLILEIMPATTILLLLLTPWIYGFVRPFLTCQSRKGTLASDLKDSFLSDCQTIIPWARVEYEMVNNQGGA